MSEPIWCMVTFKFPETWEQPDPRWHGDPEHSGARTAPWFVQQAHEALINGEMSRDGEYRDRRFHETPGTWKVSGEGNFGLNDSYLEPVLDWCREHRVPFEATSDPKYDMPGEVVVFDGERECTGVYDGNQVVLTRDDYSAIEGGSHDMFSTVSSYFDTLNDGVDGVSVDHLPATCPGEDDEDDDSDDEVGWTSPEPRHDVGSMP